MIGKLKGIVDTYGEDYIILDVGGDPLKRIPMMEPLRGTKAHVESLFESVESPADLVGKLAG